MEFFNEAVALALALVVGAGLKHWAFKGNSKAAQWIPLLNFAAQFLGRLALEAAPAEAGVFGKVGAFAYSLAFESAVTAILASGAQSSAKATGRVFLSVLKQILLQKAADKVAAEQAKTEVK